MNSRVTARMAWAIVILILCQPFAAPYADAQELTLTSQSQDAKSHFWMGMTDFVNGWPSRAAEHFTAAISADPDLGLAYVTLSIATPGLDIEARRDNMNAAIGRMASSSIPELLFASAFRQQINGDAAGAQALLAATSGLVPDDPNSAYFNALFLVPGSPERMAALTDVAERFPDFAATYNTLAYLRWNDGDKAGARRDAARYVELLPDHPNSHDSAAEILQFSGLYSESIRHYEKAISLDADYVAGYTGLAEVRLLSGDAEGARTALGEARKHAVSDQQSANLKRFIANAYFFEGNGAMGMRTLNEAATELESANAAGLAGQAHRELAVAEAVFGSAGKIATHIGKAVELTPRNSLNHSWAAIAYGIAGDVNAARKAARAYDEASDNDSVTKTLDAIVALISGQHTVAEKLLVESGLEGQFGRAFMVRCQQEMGNAAEAMALKNEIMADHQFTASNFSYTLSRQTLAEQGAGHVRAGMESK